MSQEEYSVDNNANASSPSVPQVRNGYLVYTFPSGDVYEGEWVNDLMHGQGKQVLNVPFLAPGQRSLKTFVGTFVSGVPTTGRAEWSDGVLFDGTLQNGIPNSVGEYILGDVCIVGKFEDGQPVGKVEVTVRTQKELATAFGVIVDGYLHGPVRVQYHSGYPYNFIVGTMNKGVFEGDIEVVMLNPTGYSQMGVPNHDFSFINSSKVMGTNCTYMSSFKGHVSNTGDISQGHIVYSDGSYYDGDILSIGAPSRPQVGDFLSMLRPNLLSIQRHGSGVLVLDNVASYDGMFMNDIMHGYGTMVFANGASYSGYFENGRRQGYGVVYHLSSSLPMNRVSKTMDACQCGVCGPQFVAGNWNDDILTGLTHIAYVHDHLIYPPEHIYQLIEYARDVLAHSYSYTPISSYVPLANVTSNVNHPLFFTGHCFRNVPMYGRTWYSNGTVTTGSHVCPEPKTMQDLLTRRAAADEKTAFLNIAMLPMYKNQGLFSKGTVLYNAFDIQEFILTPKTQLVCAYTGTVDCFLRRVGQGVVSLFPRMQEIPDTGYGNTQQELRVPASLTIQGNFQDDVISYGLLAYIRDRDIIPAEYSVQDSFTVVSTTPVNMTVQNSPVAATAYVTWKGQVVPHLVSPVPIDIAHYEMMLLESRADVAVNTCEQLVVDNHLEEAYLSSLNNISPSDLKVRSTKLSPLQNYVPMYGTACIPFAQGFGILLKEAVEYCGLVTLNGLLHGLIEKKQQSEDMIYIGDQSIPRNLQFLPQYQELQVQNKQGNDVVVNVSDIETQYCTVLDNYTVPVAHGQGRLFSSGSVFTGTFVQAKRVEGCEVKGNVINIGTWGANDVKVGEFVVVLPQLKCLATCVYKEDGTATKCRVLFNIPDEVITQALVWTYQDIFQLDLHTLVATENARDQVFTTYYDTNDLASIPMLETELANYKWSECVVGKHIELTSSVEFLPYLNRSWRTRIPSCDCQGQLALLSYTGEVNTEWRAHGHGVMKYRTNGVVGSVKGFFLHGVADGECVITYQKEVTSEPSLKWCIASFEGTVKLGTPTQGCIVFSKQDEGQMFQSYTGALIDGCMSGEGTLQYTDNSVFTGTFINGRPEKGTFTFPNKVQYTGTFYTNEDTYTTQCMKKFKQVFETSSIGMSKTFHSLLPSILPSKAFVRMLQVATKALSSKMSGKQDIAFSPKTRPSSNSEFKDLITEDGVLSEIPDIYMSPLLGVPIAQLEVQIDQIVSDPVNNVQALMQSIVEQAQLDHQAWDQPLEKYKVCFHPVPYLMEVQHTNLVSFLGGKGSLVVNNSPVDVNGFVFTTITSALEKYLSLYTSYVTKLLSREAFPCMHNVPRVQYLPAYVHTQLHDILEMNGTDGLILQLDGYQRELTYWYTQLSSVRTLMVEEMALDTLCRDKYRSAWDVPDAAVELQGFMTDVDEFLHLRTATQTKVTDLHTIAERLHEGSIVAATEQVAELRVCVDQSLEYIEEILRMTEEVSKPRVRALVGLAKSWVELSTLKKGVVNTLQWVVNHDQLAEVCTNDAVDSNTLITKYNDKLTSKCAKLGTFMESVEQSITLACKYIDKYTSAIPELRATLAATVLPTLQRDVDLFLTSQKSTTSLQTVMRESGITLKSLVAEIQEICEHRKMHRERRAGELSTERMHDAIALNDTNTILQQLHESKENVNARVDQNKYNILGLTAVQVAVQLGLQDVLRVLFSFGGLLSLRTRDGLSLARVALNAKRPSMLRCLIQLEYPIDRVDTEHDQRTLQHIAAYDADLSLVRYLLYLQANPNVTDRNGQTPLMAVVRRMGELNKVEPHALDVAMLLLKNGAYPNKVDNERNAALHFFPNSGAYNQERQSLMAMGCKPTGIRNSKNTPLVPIPLKKVCIAYWKSTFGKLEPTCPTFLPKEEWTPDANATACEECGLEFSFINRKHHCRVTGALLCDSCCSNSIKSPSGSGRARASVINKYRQDIPNDQNFTGPKIEEEAHRNLPIGHDGLTGIKAGFQTDSKVNWELVKKILEETEQTETEKEQKQ